MLRRFAGFLFVACFFFGFVFVGFGSLLWRTVGAEADVPGDRVPVVVELFTSQGCSSCPPADELLRQLAGQPIDGAEIIPLSWHVDYWNRLGWTDPYSSETATARQEMYARQLDARGLYTPQMVVDGRSEFVGSDSRQAHAAIRRAKNDAKIRLEFSTERHGDTIEIDVTAPPEMDEADWVVTAALTQPHISTNVTRGENEGRELQHTAVVRGSTNLTQTNSGGWQGSVSLSDDANPKTAIVIAQDNSGRVVAAGLGLLDGGL